MYLYLTPYQSGIHFLVAVCVITKELLGALWFDALHLGLEKVFAHCILNCYLLCLVGKQMFSEASLIFQSVRAPAHIKTITIGSHDHCHIYLSLNYHATF